MQCLASVQAIVSQCLHLLPLILHYLPLNLKMEWTRLLASSWEMVKLASGWTPVVGRRKKRPQLPPYILRRFLPNHPLWQSHTSRRSDSSSEEEFDEDLVIPQTADAYFDVVEGTPGLQINTRNTSRWTPITCRTRSKPKHNVTGSVK